jgi:hypothetical protein
MREYSTSDTIAFAFVPAFVEAAISSNPQGFAIYGTVKTSPVAAWLSLVSNVSDQPHGVRDHIES